MDNHRPLGIKGNMYGVTISSKENDPYVKINDETLTTNRKEVLLFLQAYRMGRDHKKNEIRTALGI
jgi:hypothetical protein